MNKESRYAYTKSLMSPNKNQRSSEGQCHLLYWVFQKTTCKPTQPNQTPILVNCLKLQKRKLKMIYFVALESFKTFFKLKLMRGIDIWLKMAPSRKLRMGETLSSLNYSKYLGFGFVIDDPQKETII